MSRVFLACSAFIAGTGAALLVLLGVGRVGNQWLALEAEGLRLGDGAWSYLLRWTNIAAVQVGELGGNPALFVLVHDREALAREGRNEAT